MAIDEALNRDNCAFAKRVLAENYGIHDIVSIEPVSDGRNSNGYVVYTDDQALFFKLMQEGGRNNAQQSTCALFMEYLAENGVPTPRQISSENGELLEKCSLGEVQYLAVLMTMEKGRPVPFYKQDSTEVPPYPFYAEQIGRIVGKMHAVQIKNPPDIDISIIKKHIPPIREWMLCAFGFDKDTGLERIVDQLQQEDSKESAKLKYCINNLRNNADIISDQKRSETLRQHADDLENGALIKALERLYELEENLEMHPALPEFICHDDLHPSNFLQSDGVISAMLDFENARYSVGLNDVKNLVYNAYEIEEDNSDFHLDKNVAKRSLAAYEAERPMMDEEVSALRDFIIQDHFISLLQTIQNIEPFMQQTMSVEQQQDILLKPYESPYRWLDRIHVIENALNEYKVERKVGHDRDQVIQIGETGSLLNALTSELDASQLIDSKPIFTKDKNTPKRNNNDINI